MGGDPPLSIFDLENLDVIRHESIPAADAVLRPDHHRGQLAISALDARPCHSERIATLA
jgi:hypothetical protein